MPSAVADPKITKPTVIKIGYQKYHIRSMPWHHMDPPMKVTDIHANDLMQKITNLLQILPWKHEVIVSRSRNYFV